MQLLAETHTYEQANEKCVALGAWAQWSLIFWEKNKISI
jgi:hypothetical protein